MLTEKGFVVYKAKMPRQPMPDELVFDSGTSCHQIVQASLRIHLSLTPANIYSLRKFLPNFLSWSFDVIQLLWAAHSQASAKMQKQMYSNLQKCREKILKYCHQCGKCPIISCLRWGISNLVTFPHLIESNQYDPWIWKINGSIWS